MAQANRPSLSTRSSRAPGNESFIDELERRLTEVERRSIKLDDIPVGQLQRRLELDWQPDGSVLLQPRTVTNPVLATDSVDARVIADSDATAIRAALSTVAKPTGYSQRAAPAFATDYTPNATAITFVLATLRIDCDHSGDDGEIKLRIGGAGGVGGNLIEVMRNKHVDPSAGPQSLTEVPISFFVPAGMTYRFETVTNGATPVFIFISSWEMGF